MALSRTNTTLILQRSRSFVGREDFLESLHANLCPKAENFVGRHQPSSCLLGGLGGIGKTQTALEYCYKYHNNYKWQFWITAENQTKLFDSFHSIYAKLPPDAKLSQDYFGDTLNWLETTDDEWLLVYDNLDDHGPGFEAYDVLDTYTPKTCKAQSSIIYTSQLTTIDSGVDHVLRMGPLTAEEGAKLLTKQMYGVSHVAESEKIAALIISKKFNGLPLALAHIGGFTKESGSTLHKTETIFNNRYPASWMGKTQATRQYQKPVEVVWDFALNEDQLSPDARKMIRILAFLDPDSTPESFLRRKSGNPPGRYLGEDNLTWSFSEEAESVEFLVMRRSLHKRSLITISDNTDDNSFITMHRSLQNAILMQLDKEPSTRQEIFKEVVDALRVVTPRPDPQQIPLRMLAHEAIVIPHIISCCTKFVEKSDQPISGTLEFAELLYACGFFLWSRHDPATQHSTFVLETAAKILDNLSPYREDRIAPVDKLRADILTILSLCCDPHGSAMFTKVLNFRLQIRAIRQAIIAKENFEQNRNENSETLLYNSINEVGISRLNHNEFNEAEKLFDQCFAQYKVWGSEDDKPFEYAKYYHNMGIVKMCQGRFEEAVNNQKKSVQLVGKHKNSATSGRVTWFKYDLACLMLQAGDTRGALKLHEEILGALEDMSGKYSETTLQSHYAIGAIHHVLGDLDEAEKHIRISIDRAHTAGRGRWSECSLGRAYLHLSRIMEDQVSLKRNVDMEDMRNWKVKGTKILDKYRSICDQFALDTTDDLVLFDSLHSTFHGRYTGRDLVQVIRKSSVQRTKI